MKYIHCADLGIVMFEGHRTHQEIADRLGCTPVSAGFVRADGRLQCYGESTSLGMAADVSGDTRRANAFMNEPGRRTA